MRTRFKNKQHTHTHTQTSRKHTFTHTHIDAHQHIHTHIYTGTHMCTFNTLPMFAQWAWLQDLWRPPLPKFSVHLLQLQNHYGDVFNLQMAWKPVVLINGLKAVQDVLVTCGEDTADCPEITMFHHIGCGCEEEAKGKMLRGERDGIRATQGGQWAEKCQGTMQVVMDLSIQKKVPEIHCGICLACWRVVEMCFIGRMWLWEILIPEKKRNEGGRGQHNEVSLLTQSYTFRFAPYTLWVQVERAEVILCVHSVEIQPGQGSAEEVGDRGGWPPLWCLDHPGWWVMSVDCKWGRQDRNNILTLTCNSISREFPQSLQSPGQSLVQCDCISHLCPLLQVWRCWFNHDAKHIDRKRKGENLAWSLK